MKTFINRWLVPPFLKRWDTYLLVHHPVLWHSQALFVLFYGLIAASVLFAAGFFYPLDAQHLSVHPICPIETTSDPDYVVHILFLSLGLFYWAFRQYQLGFFFSQAKEVLLTLCLYALCLWLLLGITAPAFQMGTIYKTAYHWMSDEDIKALEESGIYPYGFVFLNRDTSFMVQPADTFFQRREEILKAIVKREDILLQKRYNNDSTFGNEWIDNPSDLLYQLVWQGNWPRKSEQEQSELSYLMYRSVWNWQWTSEQEPSKLTYLSDYDAAFRQYKSIPLLPDHLGDYQFPQGIDSIPYRSEGNNAWFQRPALSYSIEDAIRSVKHARLYIEEDVYFRHLFHLRHYVLLLALVLLSSPLLRLKNVVIGTVVFSLLSAVVQLDESMNASFIETIPTACLMLTVLGLSGIGISTITKKYYSATLFFFTLVVVSILYVIFGVISSMVGELFEFRANNFVFYGIQVFSLMAALLMPYVRALPKAG